MSCVFSYEVRSIGKAFLDFQINGSYYCCCNSTCGLFTVMKYRYILAHISGTLMHLSHHGTNVKFRRLEPSFGVTTSRKVLCWPHSNPVNIYPFFCGGGGGGGGGGTGFAHKIRITLKLVRGRSVPFSLLLRVNFSCEWHQTAWPMPSAVCCHCRKC